MNAKQTRRSTRKRPFGVSVIIILLILYTLVLALILAASLGVNYSQAVIQLLDIEPIAGSVLLQYGLFPIFIVIEIAIIVGLWRLQRWAWVLLMIQLGLSMLGDIWGYFNDFPSYSTMLINVVIVFYINQRDIQRVFERKGEPVT